MHQLLSIDFIAIGVLVLVFFSIPLFVNRQKQGLFTISKRISWIMGAASIFVIYWNPTIDMVNTRLVVENGYSGLWFLKDILIVTGIGPVLFVPMWARLNITTDNQIIPLRFSGIGARLLQNFRAIYVGIFVTSILCSFFTLGVYKLIQAFYPISDGLFFTCFAFISVLLIFKNSLSTKIKTDFFVSILFLITLPVGLYFLISSLGGWSVMQEDLMVNYADKISLFPTEAGGGESLANILVFLGIQWWSARILDQSNVNTQRYFALKDSWEAFKSIFTPLIIISITFALSSFIWDAALLREIEMEAAETSYISLLTNALPNGFKGVLLVTFILGFITSFEAIMNWGASMISVDLLGERKLVKGINRDTVGYLCMALIAVLSLALAIFSSQIYLLLKLLLSISIGVGPVYILRWFWWRVNAWSQLSAMLASFVFAIGFDWYYESFQPEFIESILLQHDMSWYVFKLISITPLVTIVWLAVTYLTPADDIAHLERFAKLTKTGGSWPFPTQNFYWKKKLLVIVLFGFAGILPIWIIWILKFQSVLLGLSLCCIWLILVWLTYSIMKSILFKE